MPSTLRGPKTLSRWLELDYFNRPRKLRRLWTTVLLVTLAVSVAGVLAWALPNRTVLQAGPVSPAHAMFNHDCRLCHTGEARTIHRLLRFDASIRSVPDSACLQCHSGALHHTTQIGEQSCASCHREHRGRKALARVDDDHCTKCHTNLQRNDGMPSAYDPHVSAFAPGKHPDFRLFSPGPPVDPGTVRFNHAVHMAKEGVLTIDEKQLQKQREQVGKQGGGPDFEDITREMRSFKKMECQDCHQTDAAGRYMLPINYDRHCQSCHPLSVQLIGPWEAGLEKSARTFSRGPAPHPARTQGPDVVRGALRDRLTRFLLDNEGFLKGKRAEEARPLPGSGRARALSKEAHAWVNDQQEAVERLLFDGGGGCQFCHTEKTGPASRRNGLPEYLPSAIPERWHQHARFRHEAHRMLNCLECHAKAQTSTSARDVMLPQVETCFKCHDAGARKARADCVECHGYHDTTKRHLFRGKLTIDEARR
jgi:hypothetical protein